MKWFSRVLLLIVCVMCLAQALYVIGWKFAGMDVVESFLAAYWLPSHRSMDHWQQLGVIVFWLLLAWSCIYAVGTDIRFQNVIRCKAVKGGDTILLTDAAITKVLLNSIRKMPGVAKAYATVTNVFGGGIAVTYYIWWWQGESLVDGGDEARRRTRAIFEKILGVTNLTAVKIITKGLRHRGESDKKIAKAITPAAGAPAAKKG